MRVVQRFDEGELAGVRLALREATGDRDGVQRRGQEHAAPVPLATRENPEEKKKEYPARSRLAWKPMPPWSTACTMFWMVCRFVAK